MDRTTLRNQRAVLLLTLCLATVMGKVRREKHYDYHPVAVILLCTLLPLVFGVSVGPEAGLTGTMRSL